MTDASRLAEIEEILSRHTPIAWSDSAMAEVVAIAHRFEAERNDMMGERDEWRERAERAEAALALKADGAQVMHDRIFALTKERDAANARLDSVTVLADKEVRKARAEADALRAVAERVAERVYDCTPERAKEIIAKALKGTLEAGPAQAASEGAEGATPITPAPAAARPAEGTCLECGNDLCEPSSIDDCWDWDKHQPAPAPHECPVCKFLEDAKGETVPRFVELHGVLKAMHLSPACPSRSV